MLGGKGAHRGRHLLQIGGLIERIGHHGLQRANPEDMAVVVDQPRGQHPARGVDDPGIRGDVPGGPGIVADVEDAAVAHGDGLGPGPVDLRGEHRGVDNDQRGRPRGGGVAAARQAGQYQEEPGQTACVHE